MAEIPKRKRVKVRGEEVMMTQAEISVAMQQILESLDEAFKDVLGHWDVESGMLEILGSKKRQRDAWVKMIRLSNALNDFIEFASK